MHLLGLLEHSERFADVAVACLLSMKVCSGSCEAVLLGSPGAMGKMSMDMHIEVWGFVHLSKSSFNCVPPR